MSVRAFRGILPRLHPSCFVDASAQVIGDVELGEDSSLWFNTVVRGDVNAIRIGRRTNVQDLCLVHVVGGRLGTVLGDDITVGHHVVLHGCTLADRVLVGMGAVLLDGVEVGEDCVIAAGALLTPGTRIPAGSLVMGSPARVKRPVRPDEREWILGSARAYVGYAREYLEGLGDRTLGAD